MIERKNIIKLIGDRTNVYHSALLTTYSFDPIYFESIYLSTLRKLGITNIVVLMDANMYDQLLADADYQCHRVTQYNYTLVRQENAHSGVFHPKTVLLFGEEEGALIVGSGNLTYSGLSNNDEVWNVFHVQGNESANYPLFYKAWKYLSEGTIAKAPLVQRQIDWMIEQSPWLQKESDEKIVNLATGDECQLLFNTSNNRILDFVYASIGSKEIDKITVIAPFYDTEGNAMKQLHSHFSPLEMQCVLDLDRQSAPYALLQEETSIVFKKANTPNPLHAKIIEIQGKEETWLLSGSANAGNMALGTSSYSFNDEACILLHSNRRRDYIKDLGIQFSELSSEEKQAITRQKQEKKERTPLKVKLISCEEEDNKLCLRFNKVGIEGSLIIYDNAQNIVFNCSITTNNETIVNVNNADINSFHIAVVKDGDLEISNRILIIREINIERGNPDPKRRKLSSLLDDADLLDNLNHILGYIEFEDTAKKVKAAKPLNSATKEEDDDDVIVTRDRFNVLKDSSLSISMHSGVRILTYLRNVFFKTEETRQSEEELSVLKEEGTTEFDDIVNEEPVITHSEYDDAIKMKSDVVKFLYRMLDFLLKKTQDDKIYGEINPAVSKPRLIAVPNVNEATSMAVAAIAVNNMMNKYSSYLDKIGDIRDLFVKCAGIFLSIYSNRIPNNDSFRCKKTREFLRDATVDILTALCFFSYPKENSSMPQLVLNCLEAWRGEEEQNEIVPLFEEQLQKLNPESIYESSVCFIKKVATTYLKEETPLDDFSVDYSTIYQLRKGYGFLVIDNIIRNERGWNFSFHSPWFDDNVVNFAISKFKGYKEFHDYKLLCLRDFNDCQ